MIFDTFDDFLGWFRSLNRNESIDMHEAYTIYLDQETYINSEIA